MELEVHELDERVELIQLRQEKQANLQLVEKRSSLGTFWAKVRPMSGREQSYAQQTQARANYLVGIRYQPALTEDDGLREEDVVVWRGHDMNIRFIRDAGPQREFLILECERGAPQ